MKKKITIAIDGHSACGKSTLARGIADTLEYTFIDSGAMYRGVALYAIRNSCLSKDILDVKRLISLLPELSLNFYKSEEGSCLYMGEENIEDEIFGSKINNKIRKGLFEKSENDGKISAVNLKTE